jgi:hypothetical protein
VSGSARLAATLQRYTDRFAAAGATIDVTSDPYHRAIWSVTFRGERSPLHAHAPHVRVLSVPVQLKDFSIARPRRS